MIQLSDEGFLCWVWEFKDDEKMLENIKNIRAAENVILRHNISLMEIIQGESDVDLANVTYYANLLGTKIKVTVHEFEMAHERERLDQLVDTFFHKRENGEIFDSEWKQELHPEDEASDIEESDEEFDDLQEDNVEITINNEMEI
jgi:hypothetical protein